MKRTDMITISIEELLALLLKEWTMGSQNCPSFGHGISVYEGETPYSAENDNTLKETLGLHGAVIHEAKGE